MTEEGKLEGEKGRTWTDTGDGEVLGNIEEEKGGPEGGKQG